jgi:hypothetical protein
MVGSCGCSSIYHQTRTQLPPEPKAELSLRLDEATETNRQLEKAGRQLLEVLRRRSTSAGIEFDRLELAVHELERGVMAAAVAAQRCEPTAESEAKLESLQLRSRAWGAYVEANRAADPVTQEQKLEELFQTGHWPASTP